MLLLPRFRNAIDTVDLQLVLRIVVLLGGQTVRRISELEPAIRFVHQIIGAIELLSLIGISQNRDLCFRVEGPIHRLPVNATSFTLALAKPRLCSGKYRDKIVEQAG